MIGLKEQTVRGAKSFAELRAKHKWNVPADYNVVIDCLDRHTELRDKVARHYGRQVVQFTLSLPAPKPAEPEISGSLPPPPWRRM